jgi:hypothetical protein
MTSGLTPFRLLIVASLVALSACAESDPIRQYTVVKAVASSEGESGGQAVPDRSGVAWFFKVLGPRDAVEKLVEPFGKLVSSVRFKDGLPEWTVPEGWEERRESGIRFATLTIPGEPPLEATVIPLPATDPASPVYLRDNLNRWRDQVGLPPVQGDDWMSAAGSAGELSQVEVDGRTVSIMNLAGKTEKDGDARMLVALVPSSSEPSASATSPPAASLTEAPLPFTFRLPEGWEQQPAGQFQLAKFTAGSPPLTISVSTAGGDLAANVNRWRGQVALASVSAEEIEASAKPIMVDGAEGKLFAIEGETESILGVVLPRGGTTWFFKAMGPTATTQAEKDRFESFLQSIDFRD